MIFKSKNQLKNSGFTIVELLVVIVIIAVLATVTVVAYSGVKQRSQYSALQANIKQINSAILMYYTENGVYPNSGTTYVFTGSNTNFIPNLVPTYINKIPTITDTGNSDYWAYIINSTATEYKIIRLVPGGVSLPSVELTGNTRIDPVRPTRGWGYWSSGGSGL